MKTLMRAMASVLWDCCLTTLKMIGGVLAMCFFVGSFVYLPGIIGESLIAGRVLTMAEIDGRGPLAVKIETGIFYFLVIFWSASILMLFAGAVQKKMASGRFS